MLRMPLVVLICLLAVSSVHAQPRTELLQQKQIALQELTIARLEQQDLMQQDQNAARQQQQLQYAQGRSITEGYQITIQRQQLMDLRRAISQALSANSKAQIEIMRKVQDLDRQIGN